MTDVPRTMRALRKETPSPGYKLVTDLPVPEPVDDEVLIKVDMVGICGSDIALYNWTSVAQVELVPEESPHSSVWRSSPRSPSSPATRPWGRW